MNDRTTLVQIFKDYVRAEFENTGRFLRWLDGDPAIALQMLPGVYAVNDDDFVRIVKVSEQTTQTGVRP